MKRVATTALLACAMLLPLEGTSQSEQPLADAFASDVLVIEASKFGCYKFDIYLAESFEQQRRGLMHVRSLPEFAGMLFVYRETAVRSMWMKNTFIPLDMLFVRADGSVSSIVQHTEPLSLRSIRSAEPVRFVLELNAGISSRLHIDTDSLLRLEFPDQ